MRAPASVRRARYPISLAVASANAALTVFLVSIAKFWADSTAETTQSVEEVLGTTAESVSEDIEATTESANQLVHGRRRQPLYVKPDGDHREF